MFGFVKSAVSSVAKNTVGRVVNSVTQGVKKTFSNVAKGDVFGAFNSALGIFGNLAGGLNPMQGMGLLSGGNFPQLPGMNNPMGQSAMGRPVMGAIVCGIPARKPALRTSDPSLQGAAKALTGMRDLREDMNNLIANKNMSSEEKRLRLMECQQQMQSMQQLLQLVTNMSKTQHQTSMAIIGNIR